MAAPIACHAFFKQTEFERLFSHNLLQIMGFTAKILHFVGRGSAGCVASKTPLPSLHEVFRPFVVDALGNAFTATQLSDAVFAAQAVKTILIFSSDE